MKGQGGGEEAVKVYLDSSTGSEELETGEELED